jgi:hypothetical protein
MRVSPKHRPALAFAAAIAAVLTLPVHAGAQTKIYPPGTDCANQPTIAERLLCGRQEFRRQPGASVEQPTAIPPAPQGADRPFPETPAPPPVDLTTPAVQELSRTASPNH